MTESEFRDDLLAVSASRAEAQACGMREAFVSEVLERLRDAGEVPDGEPCAESLRGQHNRVLEIDAWADDEADGSLHMFIALFAGAVIPELLHLSDAREQGFNRLMGIWEQGRTGWLGDNIEESRPLWSLARRIQTGPRPTALRLSVISDRLATERLREISSKDTKDGLPVTFQIWDITRMKRIHDSTNVRDDLVVDFSSLPAGGLPVLPAAVGLGDYDAYLAVVPGEALADIYIEHGSRLLEGNVRTFLGRSGNVNRGIAHTVSNFPDKFFAFNNGITATASEIQKGKTAEGNLLITSATDLQIVNGAQTTASLAASRRDKSLKPGTVFVPMKLSVVTRHIAADLIPAISKYANSQNGVRPSDFFANHSFHRRMEEASRRILAPSTAGSQVQTHWYYERARGQYLNDQVGMSPAQRTRFQLLNPRKQLITKTDLAKISCCFLFEADIACKGSEKAFVSFAEKVARDWADETARANYNDEWFKAAVAQVILFRSAECLVSKASWYEGGYRAQIVAHSTMRLAHLAKELGSGLDFTRIWNQQCAGSVLEAQLALIGQEVLNILLDPPKIGQNIGEWAKLQACRHRVLETRMPVIAGFEDWVASGNVQKVAAREGRKERRLQDQVDAQRTILSHDRAYWIALREFCSSTVPLAPDEQRALSVACRIPTSLPNEKEAMCLLRLQERVAAEFGWPRTE
jgi:hypothetical protein